jgi:prepilin-type N-terminal cleavage/methylation domain-containing protein
MRHKGFTLIELLVVVGIIGILATVVIASLSSARMKAKDAAVAESLSGYRSQAELDYPNGNYTGLCASSELTEINNYIETQGGSLADCDDGNNDYRIIVNLPSSLVYQFTNVAYAAGEDSFCVNSLGTAQKVMSSEVSEFTAPACTQAEALSAQNTGAFYCLDCWGGCREMINGEYVGSYPISTCGGVQCQEACIK